MTYQSAQPQTWSAETCALPVPPESETLALLRGFLAPILETASSWEDLHNQLVAKDYGIAFRQGHLVILNGHTSEAICTGAMLGTPLREIARRIGKPAVKAHVGGRTGDLA